MFTYQILELDTGPFVQIFYGDNVIDETGPWESIASAAHWAEAYVGKKNAGIEEPFIP